MNFPKRKNEFDRIDGPVRYIDGSSLKRSTKMPWAFRGIAAIFVSVAVIVGGIFVYNVADEVINAPLREAEATQANLNREVSLDLPVLKNLVYLDDATILASFNELGLTIYTMTSTEETAGGGFEIIKLPEGVSVTEAGAMYLQGVSSLSSADAARLLNGSWRMDATRLGGVNMSVKYADFTSGGLDAAVQNAIIAQGFDAEESVFGEAGVDGAGNTFQEGTITIDGLIYNWRVSTCYLSDFYSVSGLPKEAAYVGIRMY